MKLGRIVAAGAALRKLVDQDLSLKKAYEIFMLVKKVNEYLTYFDEHSEKIQKMADNQDEKLAELLNTDIEVTFKPVKLYLDENINLSVLDMMNLEGFIDFEEKPQEEKEDN